MTRATNGLGLLALRLALGAVFIGHGAQKLFGAFDGPGLSGTSDMFDGLGIPLPGVMAPFVGAVELAGGALLIVGLAVPVIGVMLAGDMIVALFTAHVDSGFFASNGGFEFVLILGAASFALACTGAGRFSLDEGFGLTRRVRTRFVADRRQAASS